MPPHLIRPHGRTVAGTLPTVNSDLDDRGEQSYIFAFLMVGAAIVHLSRRLMGPVSREEAYEEPYEWRKAV
jgi:hypothetical protein